MAFKKILTLINFLKEYILDLLFVIRFNTYSPFGHKAKRVYYRIIIVTHTLEKGMALANMRPLFGKSKIKILVNLEKIYDYNFSSFPIQMLLGALDRYIIIHEDLKINNEYLSDLNLWKEKIRRKLKANPNGGIKLAEEIYTPSIEDRNGAKKVLFSRFSFRNFNETVVPFETIEKVVSLAQKAPSQCNRQSARVHCYKNKTIISSLLKLQGGSNGFRDRVNNLFVVTSESMAWGGPGQRNQAFVDGGLFSQMLMLSLQAHGLLYCPLNLAISNKIEGKIKKVGRIPVGERLIMMIAFGECSIDSDLKAASSPRIPLSDVLNKHF
jgi:nitroreductase